MARYSTRNGGERDGKGGDEEAEGSRDTGGQCTLRCWTVQKGKKYLFHTRHDALGDQNEVR